MIARRNEVKRKLTKLMAISLTAAMLTSCGLPGLGTVEEEPEPVEVVEDEADDGGIELPPSEGSGFKPNEDTEGAEDEQATVADPRIIVMQKFYYEVSDDEYYNSLLQGHVQIPLLSDESAEDYPELAAALKTDAGKRLEEFDHMVDESITEVKEWYKEMDPEEFYGGYEVTHDIVVKRADDRVVSMFVSMTQYSGGAHGIYGNTPVNYDARTGKKLNLADVITSEDGFADLVKDALESKYADELEMFYGLDDSLSHYTTGDVSEDQDIMDDDYQYSYTWALDHEGLEIYFGPYELAPYASGDQSVVLKYSDHPDLFVADYLPDEGEKGYIEYFNRFTANYDVNGDGDIDYIGLDNLYENDDYNYPVGLQLYVNDETMDFPEECDLAFPDEAKGYYVHTADGRNLIYVLVPSYNDFSDLVVFDVTDGKIRYVGTDCRPSFVIDYDNDEDTSRYFILYDPDNMQFADRFDIVCTFEGFKSYHVGSDGMPETDDEIYTIYQTVGWEPIECVKAFEAECVDDESAPEMITINAGETFEFRFTDGRTYVDAEISDGRMVRLYFDEYGNDVVINGEDANQLFKELMYAG